MLKVILYYSTFLNLAHEIWALQAVTNDVINKVENCNQAF